jgi:hypothetical protein
LEEMKSPIALSQTTCEGKAGDPPPASPMPFAAAAHGLDTVRTDAAAGCEYVDDRIRLPE